MTFGKRILADAAIALLIVPLLAGCGQSGSNESSGTETDQQSASSNHKHLSVKEIVGTAWEYKGKTIEFSKEPYQSIKSSSASTLPDRAYKDGGTTAYDPNLPSGLSTKDQTPLYKLNNESVVQGSNYYHTSNGEQYPYFYSLTTYFPTRVETWCETSGNTTWNPSSDSIHLDVMSQLYGGLTIGCYSIQATNKEMTITQIQYTDGSKQDNSELEFFGQGAKAEAEVNNNKIILRRAKE